MNQNTEAGYGHGFHIVKGQNTTGLAGHNIRQWDERRLESIKGYGEEKLPPTICFSRRIGAGALEIAEIFASMLGCPVINREIIDHIADEAELSDKTVRLFDGRYPGKLREFVAMAFGEKSFVQSDYNKHLFNVVFSLAGMGSNVFVGRGIHLVLPRDRVLAVRITASREFRVRRIMDGMDLSLDQAELVLDRVDDEQRAFFRNVYGKKTAESGEFDLIINRDHIRDSRIAAKIISLAYGQKFGIDGKGEGPPVKAYYD